MNSYHKIHNVFRRDHETNKVVWWGFSKPEFHVLRDIPWLFTEKIDGMNMRIIYDDGLRIAGRTDKAQIKPDLRERCMEIGQKLEKHLVDHEDTGHKVCLYGEGFGPKIQKVGGLYGEKRDFILFDVWVNGQFLPRDEVEEIAETVGCLVVPAIGLGTLRSGVETVARGLKSKFGDFWAEGLIGRPVVELRDGSSGHCGRGERIITKIKHRDLYIES